MRKLKFLLEYAVSNYEDCSDREKKPPSLPNKGNSSTSTLDLSPRSPSNFLARELLPIWTKNPKKNRINNSPTTTKVSKLKKPNSPPKNSLWLTFKLWAKTRLPTKSYLKKTANKGKRKE